MDIGIDLGTANIVMTMGKRGVVLNEPSVIAFHKRTERVVAIGRKAYSMIGRAPDYLAVVRPLKDGVISDDELTQCMIREFILKVSGRQLLKPRIIICVPSFITDVERRAVMEAARSAGSRKVNLIQEPLAAMLYLPEDGEYMFTATSGRRLLVHTGAISPKTSRTTIGVQVMTVKGRHRLAAVEPFAEGMAATPNRYRTKTLPAAGAMPAAEDFGEQLTLE